jgi:LmbE family N-acetylglucosaminyl deacetylase
LNVLVISPHPDDESIGPGGSLWLHHQRGDRVSVVHLTSGELGLKHIAREQAWALREAEAGEAAAILGIEKTHFLRLPDWGVQEHLDVARPRLVEVLLGASPDLIYAPHADDEHPDHAAASPLLLESLRLVPHLAPRILTYEVWTPLSRFDHTEDISAVMPRKLDAIRAHRSQLEQFRYDRAAEGLAAYRGALAAKCDRAEVFLTLM